MKGIKRSLILAAAILILPQSVGGFVKVLAKKADTAVALSAHEEEELVHVELPTFPEGNGSVFDFIMDPQGLIEATGAAKYDGQGFEEGGTLFFKNEGGAYAYSSKSDQLTVTNKSAVPVEVTVTAKLDNCQGLNMSEDEGFLDGNAELFLAVMDDRGTVMPLKGSEEISVISKLDAASEQGADTYSFGLTGACNPDGDWGSIESRLVVTVTWKVKPLFPEEKEPVTEETEEIEETESAADEPTAAEPESSAKASEKPSAPSEEPKPDQSPAAPGTQIETESPSDQSVSTNKLKQK